VCFTFVFELLLFLLASYNNYSHSDIPQSNYLLYVMQNIILYPSIVNYLSCITQIYPQCCSPHKLRSGLVDNCLMSRHHNVHVYVRHVLKYSLSTHIGIAEIAKTLSRRIHLLDLPLVVDTFRSFPHS
jgi:hypothetical protein